jgi:hypothetical protein
MRSMDQGLMYAHNLIMCNTKNVSKITWKVDQELVKVVYSGYLKCQKCLINTSFCRMGWNIPGLLHT